MSDEREGARTPGPAGELLLVSAEERTRGIASPEDVIAFQDRFLRLLERRTAIYTMGDSSSVPRYIASDLLRSVCFVLGIDPDEPVVTQRLLSVDLEDEFRRNLVEIERKVELTGKLWRDACDSTPRIPNIALRDTLASIGDFPSNYDLRSMAHEIPCSIDYPLCHPVPESLVGVDYVNEYLHRLVAENEFVQRFEVALCTCLLSNTSPDYVGLLVNLYEPIATNAIGRALIGQDPLALDISPEDRAQIARRLNPLGQSARIRVMLEAAGAICDSLGIHDDRAQEYLSNLMPDLLPRVQVGLLRGDLAGVFVSCGGPIELGCGI